MIRLLELRDFALVHQLELELAPGLNAFTGETGAGKSLLVDALLQLAGNRADPGLIRSGSNNALVQAEITSADGPITLSRRLQQNGRNTARIDGELVTLAELARRSAPLLAIHGQHGAVELADPAAHLHLLDRLLTAGARTRLERHAELFARSQALARELSELETGMSQRLRRLDQIGWELDEINRVRPVPGEDEELRSSLQELRNADSVVSGAAAALELLLQADNSATSQLDSASRALTAAARYNQALVPLAEELQQSLAAVQATASEVEAFLEDFSADPHKLDQAESRLAQLEGLKRKYGADLDQVLTYAAALEDERERMETADADLERLTQELAGLTSELAESAALLASERRAAAATLEAGVLEHLDKLGMQGARFEVAFSALQAMGRFGSEKVRFIFSANPGEPLRDLADVASGGELSRLLLALHLVVGAEQPVLVFDEVDAGTGGKAALAIGSLLRQLAVSRQVLVVTHLPQVAAYAHVQYSVSKEERDGRTLTSVRRLDGEARLEELSRMLAGKSSDASQKAAAELLAAAATG